jgi:hypothetical protein
MRLLPNVLLVILSLEYKDDEVEELCDVIKKILEKNGKGVTNTIVMGDWNSMVGDEINHIRTLLDHMDWEEEIREVKCLLTFVKEMDLLSSIMV